MAARKVSASPARDAARETLARVRERSAYAHETLDAVLNERKLSPRDAAFATRLAYGAIAARGTLEEAVARYLAPDVRLEPKVSDALVIGAYELLFMRTPTHAAVSETVDLVRSVRPQAAGLANAVMRKLSADVASFPWGDPDTDISVLARKYAHPAWLTDTLVGELGRQDAESVLAADNEPAPLFLAFVGRGSMEEDLDRLDAEGAAPGACPLPRCVLAEDSAAARRSTAVRNGRFIVMDAGAQLAVQAAASLEAATVVEIGAGRGSKTLLLGALMAEAGNEGDVVAVDLHAFKLDRLKSSAEKLGLTSVRTVVADAASPDSDLGVADGSADVVLVDAPCSGIGTLRRHPDRRWRATSEEIDALAVLGERLLGRASRLVRPGGFVVYSTCTIIRRENEDVVEGFLASEAGRGFAIHSLLEDVPPEWRRFVAPQGWFRSLPEPGGPDGHFVARLVRV